jgi:lipopolysaccharide cholinephosphotransferase
MRLAPMCLTVTESDIKAELLNILKILDGILSSEDIPYSIAGGTMIGAIRNEGFLPWDDDADIMMTDEDFDRFKKYYDKHPVKNYILPTAEEYPDLDNTGNGFRNLRGIHSYSYKLHHSIGGFSVDTFRLLPLKSKNVEEELLKHRLLCGLKNPVRVYFIPVNKRYYRLTYLYYYLSKFIPLKLMEKLFFRNVYAKPGEPYTHYVTNHNIDATILHKRELYDGQELVRVDFEGLKVPIQKDYISRLWARAGGSAWRYIPEDSAKRSHHTLIDNLTVPYFAYRDDYLRIFPHYKKYYNRLKKARIRNFKIKVRRREAVSNLTKPVSYILSANIDGMMADMNTSIKAIAEENAWQKLLEIFSAWYKYQFDNTYPEMKLFYDIGDEKIYYGILPYMNWTGEYFKAKKIISRLREKREPDARFISILDNIKYIEDAYWEMDNKRTAAAEKIVAEGLAKFPGQINLIIQSLEIMSINAKTEADFLRLKEQAEEQLVRFPDNGEIMKYLADAHLGLGETEKAKEMYGVARMVMRNGMTILDISKKLGEVQ